MKYADDTVVEFLNTIVRKHKLKHKRKRVLDPAKIKPQINGGSGVAYAPDKLST